MIKQLIIVFALIIPLVGQTAWKPSDKVESSKGYYLRNYYKLKKLRLLFEYHAETGLENREIKNIKLGGRYRLGKHFKLGLFFHRSYGLRHDEDWVGSGSNWSWQNTDDRGENILELEGTIRFMLTERLVGELRTSYFMNNFNDNKTLMLRPGLTYFIVKDGKPLVNIFFQVASYMALNFSQVPLYKRYFYFGGIYHINSKLSLGPYLAKGTELWTQTDSFKEWSGASYENTFESTQLGLVLTLKYN